MGSNYEIDISMSQATMDTLKKQGFALFAFKAVKTKISSGAPVAWFRNTKFLPSTSIRWEENYQAYISDSAMIPQGEIDATNSFEAELGQTANVTETGVLSVDRSGTPGAISILNQGKTSWIAGISQTANGVNAPMCAIPLNGKMMDVIVPIEKVLVTFTSSTINTGTVFYQSYSTGMLIDLTGITKRSVSFDIDNGWSNGGQSWGREITPNQDLVPLLIEN